RPRLDGRGARTDPGRAAPEPAGARAVLELALWLRPGRPRLLGRGPGGQRAADTDLGPDRRPGPEHRPARALHDPAARPPLDRVRCALGDARGEGGRPRRDRDLARADLATRG